MSRLTTLLAALCLAPVLALAQNATPLDGRLKKIRDTRTIAVAYRTDALPFSFEDADKKPAGYTVDLCRTVIGVIERQLGAGSLDVRWVPVTSQNRLAAVANGQADMECGATTVTLGRMKEVDFSSLTFVDGTGLLVKKSTGGNSLIDLAGKKIGVIAGTSNERALNDALKAKVMSATVVPVKSRDEGLAHLESGAIDAMRSRSSRTRSCCRAATGRSGSPSIRRSRRSTRAARCRSSTTAGSHSSGDPTATSRSSTASARCRSKRPREARARR